MPKNTIDALIFLMCQSTGECNLSQGTIDKPTHPKQLASQSECQSQNLSHAKDAKIQTLKHMQVQLPSVSVGFT
jgi:hypothetical protein